MPRDRDRRTSTSSKYSRRRVPARSSATTDARSSGSTGAAAAILAASFVVATEILRWSTRKPKCASSALSTLRTVCLGANSDVVSRWISSTTPAVLATIFADNTPGNVANNSSARRIGNTLPAIGDPAPAIDDTFGAELKRVGLRVGDKGLPIWAAPTV